MLKANGVFAELKELKEARDAGRLLGSQVTSRGHKRSAIAWNQ